MKLQKQLSRKVGDREYPKWVITIPSKQIEELGWNVGDELRTMIKDNKLILENVPKKEDA